MLTLGFIASRNASAWQDSLASLCSNPALIPEDGDISSICPRTSAGRYLIPEQQTLYHAHEAANSRAQKWLLGGEIALVATGAMFLVDLIHRDGGPQNIPFTPFRLYASRGQLGLSLDLPARRS